MKINLKKYFFPVSHIFFCVFKSSYFAGEGNAMFIISIFLDEKLFLPLELLIFEILPENRFPVKLKI